MEKKEIRKQFYVGRIIVSLIIATLLFLGVFFFGYYVAFNSYEEIAAREQVILNNLLSLQLEKELIADSCKDLDLVTLSEELSNMGGIIGLLEEELGKKNPEVIEQKKIYSILEVEHMLFVKEKNEKCNLNNPIVLFFYSNEPEYLDRAEEIGFILSTKKQQNPNIMIYSFDYDLDSSLIDILKRVYVVKEQNSVVVNGKVITDLYDIEDLNNAIDITAPTAQNEKSIIHLS